MTRKACLVLLGLLLLGAASSALLHAEGQRRHDRRWQREQQTASDPLNAEYAAACGECHFAYHPWLLPAASWEKLVNGLDDHFGSPVSVTKAQRKTLRGYLTENAADKSSSKRARNMLKDLDGQTPLRITETSCFLRKHRSLSAEVFKKPSVGGAGNCPACHTTATQGDYDDDNARVPR